MLTTSTQTPSWLAPKGRWLRFLKHHPITSPPTKKIIVMSPETFTPNIVFKNPSLKDIGEFRFLSMSCLFSLLGAVNAVLSFMTAGVSRSVLLYRVGEQTQVRFGNIRISFLSKAKDYPGGLVAKTLCSQCRGPGFDPWSGNQIPHVTTKRKKRSHMLQLKILHAAMKTWHSQINK